METKSQREGAVEAMKTRLAARWAKRDPFELANRATAQLMDSAADWSPPPGVEFKRPPVRLGVGIPTLNLEADSWDRRVTSMPAIKERIVDFLEVIG
jgi:hypothetical protein